MQQPFEQGPPPGSSPQGQPVPVAPQPAPVRPASGGGSRWLVILLGVLAVGGLSYYLWNRQATERAAAKASASAVRTVSVRRGAVTQTLRLTGATAAEKFASLLVPQLRGSRGDSLRDGKTFPSPGANYTVQSNTSKSVGGGTIGASPSSGGGAGDGQLASTMGQSSGGNSALRSATSRVGGSSGAARGGSGSMSNSTAGSEGALGSTSNQLAGTGFAGGGGGGGGRGSDYMMVLQSAGKAGAKVKKGEQVAEFDRVNMLNRLEDYRAAVAQMDASFVKLKAEVDAQKRARLQQLENAKAALDQARLDLKTIPVLGAIEAERVKLAAEEADAKYKQLLAEQKFSDASFASQVRVAQLELQQAHSELKRAEANTDRMIMKAPIDGLIVMQSIFRGGELAQIQQGDQLWPGMRFMQVVDPSSMIVNATVNQVDAEMVRVGQKAIIHFDAFPELSLPATVEALGAMTRPGNQRAAFVKEIPVVLRLDEMDPRVIPDLSVSVDVRIASEAETVVAPSGSVFEDEGRPGVKWVWVRQGQNWQKRQIETGLASALEISVRSGLQEGDVVALEPPPGAPSASSPPKIPS